MTVGYTTVDLKGDTRIILNYVDIGAYEYEDPQPGYKLVDKALSNDLMDNVEFKVFPNPASTFISVVFNSDENTLYKICLFNIIGEVVYDKTAIGTGSEMFNLIDLTKFVKGIYIIRIADLNNELIMSKVERIIVE